MLRKMLGVVVSLGLPALLAGQSPATPKSNPALTHARATQFLGEVVMPKDIRVEEQAGQNNDAHEGKNQDVDDHDVDQEGVDEPDGPNHEGHEGVKDSDGPNHDDDEGTAPAANRRIGRHKP